MLNLINNLFNEKSNRDVNDEGSRSRKTVTVLGRLPGYFPEQGLKEANSGEIYMKETPYKHTKRANRFLQHQEGRIVKAINEKNYTKAVFLGCILLKSSYVYQTCLMNRVVPQGYYKGSREEVRLFQMEVKRKLRKGDLTLTLERIYLDKGMEKTGIPNGKYRPIGSPTLVSRIISKAFNDMIYAVFQGDFALFQHGYRMNKGTHTALTHLWERIFMQGEKTIYEFDFRSFFNSVSRSQVYEALATKSAVLGDMIFNLLKNINYVFKELKPEPELVMKYEVKGKVGNGKEKKGVDAYKNLIVRNGLPQGLSISPLLATLVLEGTGAPAKHLLMYADDGLFLGATVERYLGFGKLSKQGIQLSKEKTGLVGDEFEFLGTTGNRKEKWVRYRDSILTGTTEEEKMDMVPTRISDGFKKVTSKYGKKPGEGTGDIHEDSGAMGFKSRLMNPITRMLVMGHSAANRSYLNFRYFMGKGIFHISALSSRCCNGLLENKNEDKYFYKLVDHYPKGMKKTEDGKPSAFAILVKTMRESNPEFLKQKKLVIKDKGRTRVKSKSAGTVIINPEYKFVGQLKSNRFEMRNQPRYFELVLPYSKKLISDKILNNSRTDNNFFPHRTGLQFHNPLDR